MQQRLLWGIGLAAASVLSILYLPSWAIAALLVGINGLAFQEWQRMTHTFSWTALAATSLYLILPNLEPLFFLLLLTLFLSHFSTPKGALKHIGTTLLGVAIITYPLACGLGLFKISPLHFLFPLVISKGTDIAAYLIGSQWGSHPLLAHISPKKTWEGAIGGLGAALALGSIFPFPLALSLLLGLLSECGDLVESLLKRDAGVKDSGVLPGLGGILDLTDSLIFTLPLMYLVAR